MGKSLKLLPALLLPGVATVAPGQLLRFLYAAWQPHGQRPARRKLCVPESTGWQVLGTLEEITGSHRKPTTCSARPAQVWQGWYHQVKQGQFYTGQENEISDTGHRIQCLLDGSISLSIQLHETETTYSHSKNIESGYAGDWFTVRGSYSTERSSQIWKPTSGGSSSSQEVRRFDCTVTQHQGTPSIRVPPEAWFG